MFVEEAARLLPLPDNPAPLLERVAVSVGRGAISTAPSTHRARWWTSG
jgi:hypothetical protein